jgi:outer membrane protein assembly factor BamA
MTREYPEALLRVVGLVLALVATARADRLSPADLARKNEGGYVTGLPLAAYSADMGYGAGARVYYYWNGARSDERFATTPYLYRVFVQAFASTRGVQFHWLDLDAPRIADSPYRIRAQFIFARATNSNYFGLGERSLDVAQPYSKLDQYDLLKPAGIASVERGFDHVRLFAGLGFLYARVHEYAATRLEADCAAQLIVGCEGGRDHYLRLGVSYDTRDFEPDPNRGVFVDAALDVGTAAVGSAYDYARFLVAARSYYSPIQADLVLATRGVFEWQSAGTPFFSMNTLPFTEDPRQGLGGLRTLRGYRQDRFVGPVMALFNQEVRWTFARTTLWRQKLAFIAVPFFEIGRPFDKLSDLTFARWQPSYGGALRLSWNLATVITADYGMSPDDSGFYINFGHIF